MILKQFIKWKDYQVYFLVSLLSATTLGAYKLFIEKMLKGNSLHKHQIMPLDQLVWVQKM
jgi:hypothetical protein